MRYKNSDRACPVKAVACFVRHITTSRSLNFELCLTEVIAQRSDRLIDMMNCLFDLCTHDSSVCALFFHQFIRSGTEYNFKANTK